MTEYHKDIFELSYARCTRSPRFIRSFYDKFVTKGPAEVRIKFKGMRFTQQRNVIERAVSVAASAVSGNRKALQLLEERAKLHRKTGELDIRPGLYDLWLRAIIEAAKEHDPEFNAQVAAAWKSVMTHVIQRMVRDYET